MPSLCSSALVLCSLFGAATALAQPIEMPALSLKAKVEQRAGLTDFSIEYSSPAVRKRKIWGDVVPYDKVWRGGANQATKLTVSRDFTFGGTPVKAGAYSVFMVPGKVSWTVHLNSDLNAGQNNHDAKKDVAKVTVRPVALPAVRERLLYLFNNASDDGVSFELEWERVRIAVPIAIDTKGQVAAMITRIDTEAWRPHFQAANYFHETGDQVKSLALVEKSIAIQSVWRNEWLRAQIFHKQNKKAEAHTGAQKAMTLGAKDPIYEQFFKADIEKAVKDWK
jgi:Protein of unknown function (DUF2911)